ncbi:oxidoreductase [Spirosoma taeanense]|uniref:Oxidoreductase n=1 Tax=Spirosoma taeanense TaxID=2735870 RepID=A0A6M5YBS5_9BACT|nr:oxidoreductase [Spirosoma taeanense]QJW90766.1 oxidoreductase [Spirosoma taeanense]
MNKVALVTGASSGMGESTAILLSQQGYKVYGAARRTNEMKPLESQGISVVSLDLTQDESIVNCVNTILGQEGRIDVLINNAGYGSYGAVEDVPIEEARRQFEVNIFGLARLTQLVLPTMREQKSGRIINISSMGGKIYTPYGAWYHATKHALEGWSDCLRLEVKPFGIDVVVVEPGGVKTAWGVIAAEGLKKVSGRGAYAEGATKAADSMANMYATGKNLTDQDVLAKEIVKAATTSKPNTRYVKGFMAKPMILMRQWLGDRAFDKIITSAA